MKIVTWSKPQKTAPAKVSMQAKIAALENQRMVLLKAQDEVARLLPVGLALMQIRFSRRRPLIINKTMHYQTSALEKSLQDAVDQAYYRNSPTQEKFVDHQVTLMPGTQLFLKSIDSGLNEFVFEDSQKQEHSISFDDRTNLVTHSDIWAEAQNLFNQKVI